MNYYHNYYLNNDEPFKLYLNKNDISQKTAYEGELMVLHYISLGDTETLKSILNKTKYVSRVSGKLSDDAVTQAKYNAIAGITLFTRAAIGGGVSEERAYSLSDSCILKIDRCSSEEQIGAVTTNMLFTFADEVKKVGAKGMSLLVRRTINIIDSDFRFKLTLGEISKKLNCSMQYLSATFKAQTGMTFGAYLRKRRISEAINLIGKKDVELSKLGYILGFSSQSHFISSFKRVTGKTPKEYSFLINTLRDYCEE